MIGIIDMDMGNLRSVSNAVHSLGFDHEVLRDPARLDGMSHAIIPGVGAYATAMAHLDRMNLRTALLSFAGSGRPLLGICLGMQLLSDSGVEGGETSGLGLVAGRVTRLPDAGLAIPHVGWNNIDLRRPEHPVFAKVKSGVDFYFVHSYRLQCEVETDALATTSYGADFASIVGRKNVVGFQFHPEKSQANGLKLLENFCDWDGAC